jgi:hypothetical protein
MCVNLYRKYHFKGLNDLISLINQVTKTQYSLFVKGKPLPKNTLPFYAFVRLPDDGRIRWPKHVVAEYNEYVISVVLFYSDPVIDMIIRV